MRYPGYEKNVSNEREFPMRVLRTLRDTITFRLKESNKLQILKDVRLDVENKVEIKTEKNRTT